MLTGSILLSLAVLAYRRSSVAVALAAFLVGTEVYSRVNRGLITGGFVNASFILVLVVLMTGILQGVGPTRALARTEGTSSNPPRDGVWSTVSYRAAVAALFAALIASASLTYSIHAHGNVPIRGLALSLFAAGVLCVAAVWIATSWRERHAILVWGLPAITWSIFNVTLVAVCPPCKWASGADEVQFQQLRRLAEAGNPSAQFKLGLAYAGGEGVSLDYAEAASWFRKAAEQGEAGAQSMLGSAYQDGVGVQQDSVEALKWWITAAAAASGDALKKYASDRDALSVKMTATQRAESQKRADDWMREFTARKSK
jgi:TPR repeat protein